MDFKKILLVDDDAERIGDIGLDRRLGAARVKPHAAAEIGGRIEETGEQARVGDRRLLATAAEAGRAGQSTPAAA